MVNDANRALSVARGFAFLLDNKQLGHHPVNNMLQICYKFYNIKKPLHTHFFEALLFSVYCHPRRLCLRRLAQRPLTLRYNQGM